MTQGDSQRWTCARCGYAVEMSYGATPVGWWRRWCGPKRYVAHEQFYANGTVIVTIKATPTEER